MQDTDFTIVEYAKAYRVISDFYQNASDKDRLSIIKFEAVANGCGFGSLCNDDMIIELFDIPPISVDESDKYFYQVKKEAVRRLYIDRLFKMRDYLDNTADPVVDIISRTEESIISVSDNFSGGSSSRDLYDLPSNAKDIIYKLAEDPGNNGLDIGFPIWQNYIGDISNGTVHMIIASFKVGKSQIGMKAALTAAVKYNKPVLLCDSEMNKEQQTVRAFGMFAKIPYWILKKGYWILDDEELMGPEYNFQQGSNSLNQIRTARMRIKDEELQAAFKKIPLKYLSINGMSVGEAIPHMRRWINRYTNIDKTSSVPNALIVYDYLKLPSFGAGNNNLQEYQLLGLYAGQLHDFMNQYNLPCLTFGQTNREVDRSVNCIGASKRLGDLVDSLTIMFKKSPEERLIVPDGTHGLDVLVSREGESTNDDGGYINFDFDKTMGYAKEIGYTDGRESEQAND
jgi:replicative DNA helicase